MQKKAIGTKGPQVVKSIKIFLSSCQSVYPDSEGISHTVSVTSAFTPHYVPVKLAKWDEKT